MCSDGHWFQPGFWRREWAALWGRSVAPRLPWELSWREWLAHAVLFVANYIAFNAIVATLYFAGTLVSPQIGALLGGVGAFASLYHLMGGRGPRLRIRLL